MITTLWGRNEKVEISPEGPTVLIGERINPTRKPRLVEAMTKGDWDVLIAEAVSQLDEGARVIAINVGTPEIDEVVALPQAVEAVSRATGAPLCIDSSDLEALKAALQVCGGKPLVNSTTGEEKSLECVLPLVREFGAAIIGLCHDERGISGDVGVRLDVARKILTSARMHGIEESDVLIDPLLLAVGTEAKAGLTCLTTAQSVSKELGLNVTIGASNGSYGLPDRQVVNNTFLAMAIWCGANAPIVNPAAKDLTATVAAADLLKGNDKYAVRYIRHFRQRRQNPA